MASTPAVNLLVVAPVEEGPFRALVDPRPDAEWTLVVDRPCAPRPELVRALLRQIAEDPGAAAVYSDFTSGPSDRESRADVGAWSVERSRWQDYTGAVALIRSDVVEGVREGDQARKADQDAAPPGWLFRHRCLVRAAQQGRVRYLPEPLYRVDVDRIERVPDELRIRMVADAGFDFSDGGQPPRTLREWPSVSIVIPTRGGSARVRRRKRRLIDVTMRSFIDTTAGLAPQFVLVVDDDVDLSYLAPWRAELGGRLTVVETAPPFNFSAKVNRGVEAATGEVVAILNDDMEAISDRWLENLVAAACESDVGAVGAMLLLESGDIQHAGHRFTELGPYLLDVGRPVGPGPRGRNACDRDVTGVTAACLVQRRRVWTEVGGLDEAFAVSFNDVDYCVRIAEAGYRIVQCNSSRLFHFESRTRRRGASATEIALLTERMGGLLGPDALTAYEPPPPPSWREQARYRVDKARAVWESGGVRGMGALMAEAVRSRLPGHG